MKHTRERYDFEECLKKVNFDWRKRRYECDSTGNLQNIISKDSEIL